MFTRTPSPPLRTSRFNSLMAAQARAVAELFLGDPPEVVVFFNRVPILRAGGDGSGGIRRAGSIGSRENSRGHGGFARRDDVRAANHHDIRILLQRRIAGDNRVSVRFGVGAEKPARQPAKRVAGLGNVLATGRFRRRGSRTRRLRNARRVMGFSPFGIGPGRRRSRRAGRMD